jgi:hypothetical protein
MKKRQPAASSSSLILMRAVVSLFATRFPIAAGLVNRHNACDEGPATGSQAAY